MLNQSGCRTAARVPPYPQSLPTVRAPMARVQQRASHASLSPGAFRTALHLCGNGRATVHIPTCPLGTMGGTIGCVLGMYTVHCTCTAKGKKNVHSLNSAHVPRLVRPHNTTPSRSAAFVESSPRTRPRTLPRTFGWGLRRCRNERCRHRSGSRR